MPDQEAFGPLDFPVLGVDTSKRLPEQPPGTTPVGQNARVFENLTGRGRGGSRPGLSRYISEPVEGAGVIQHMNSIVTCSGLALGSHFPGREFGDIGGWGIDQGPGGIGGPSTISGWGAFFGGGGPGSGGGGGPGSGGYQSSASTDADEATSDTVLLAILQVSTSADQEQVSGTCTLTNGVSRSVTAGRGLKTTLFMQGQTIWSIDLLLEVETYANAIGWPSGGHTATSSAEGLFIHNCELPGQHTMTMRVDIENVQTSAVASVTGTFWLARVRIDAFPNFVEWVVEGEGFHVDLPATSDTDEFPFTFS